MALTSTVKRVDNSVDPFDIPNKMTKFQLEHWILFGICVANKSAAQTKAKLKAFLDEGRPLTPFETVRAMIKSGKLMFYLKKYKLGQYQRISKAFKQAVELDLNNISVAALESVHGIGPKTARMIILYYDPEATCVPLDTHILKFLRNVGYDAPKSTPGSRKRYAELEQQFIGLAKHLGKTVRELDTMVWQSYAKG